MCYVEVTKVHFGWFVHFMRKRKKLSQAALGEFAGISGRRMSQIEDMSEPKIYDETFRGIAKGLGFEQAEDFDNAWRSTLVSEPERKPSPLAPASESMAPWSLNISPDVIETLDRQAGKEGITRDQLVARIVGDAVRAMKIAPHPQPLYPHESSARDRGLVGKTSKPRLQAARGKGSKKPD